MDLDFRAEDLAFQEEARSFIDTHWPVSLRTPRGVNSEYGKELPSTVRRWFDALIARGWSAPHWPVEHGGTDWSPTQHYIWDRETARAGAPNAAPFGMTMLAPVLWTWGTPEQQANFLPKIREHQMSWCQGYSEPGAGSDLASLATRAVRDGDHYVVNGTKIWTSGAHAADWMFCLVRTDPKPKKKQEGISFLLIDMKTPGINVTPILILGNQHTVNSVTLTDVRVPVTNLVGEQDRGWTYAKALLTHERTGIAGVARTQAEIIKLRKLANDTQADGACLIDDALFRTKLEEVEVLCLALEMTELRTLAAVESGKAPGPESSLLKIRGTELQQRVSDLQMEALGSYVAPYVDPAREGDNELPIGPAQALPALRGMLYGRAATIFGGSNEIQRNIIAKAVLGL